jgi:hypothetical protein
MDGKKIKSLLITVALLCAGYRATIDLPGQNLLSKEFKRGD